MKRWILRTLAVLVILYLAFTGVVYAMMRARPVSFNQFMAKLPMAALMTVPFPVLWNHARAGALEVGQAAPDFELRQLGGPGNVRLSSFRGERPALLIFGSYT